MSRNLLAVLPLLHVPLLLWGCASAPPPPPPRPLVMAILPSPALDALAEDAEAEPEGAGLTGSDFLLEVATQLSAEARLDLCFVPGPVVAAGVSEEEALEEALIGVSDGFGQIAAPVYLGLSKEDAARPLLLEALKESVRDHPGEPNVWGKAVLGWRPVALSAEGALAETEAEALAEAERARPKEEDDSDSEEDEAREAERATPLLVVLGDPAALTPDARVRLRVVAGSAPEVVPCPGGLELRVPPLAAGLYALAVLHPDRLELEWRSVEPERVTPPEPISLPWPKSRP
jgi:hypothetical protein